VPCCRGCYNDLSRVESDLLIRLGLCMNPYTDAPARVASTARPALGLDAGNLPEKEKSRRDWSRAKVRAGPMANGEVAETPGLIPGLVLHPGNVSESPVVPIPYSDLSKIAEKFGRGCEYKLRNRYVEPPYGLRTFIGHPDEIRAEFDGEQLFDLGPGFKVKCVRHAENPGDVAYWFLLWDTVCLKVLISFESVLIELEPKFPRPPVEADGTMARTDSPQQQSVSAQVSMPDWKQCEGAVADGKFPLDRYLGGSETSAVFLTRCASDAAVIRIEPADDDRASMLVERWNRAAALHHPHLCGILAVGTWALAGMPVAYLVMEYAEENLAEALRDRPITADEAHEMLLPVAEALAYLHSQGLVHGNLKPSNILAVGDTVKISSESASAGDPAEDIWALGTTVLQALTQRATTVAPGVQDLAVDALPSPFREILRHCLAEDPRLRWSADKIAASLRSPEPLVSTLPASATAAAKPATQKLRRWYYVAGFTLIVAASAVVGLLVIPRTAAPVVSSEPVRPLPTSASPGTTPSGPTPAPEGAPPVPPASKTQTQNVVPAAHDEIARRVLPNIPAKARNTIHGTVRVVVRVTVDSAGSVAEATPEPGGSRYFGKLAVEAVRRWRFAPAEGALPRNWILRFEITRTSTQVIPRRAKD
jgi:TonB family protein